ncbi:MAG: phosphomannomutase/phosphoglucomutase, partial [Pseudonocardiales bacterium]|nr:phosphomannomutase/phosphoglucomutase [Pseudonocardiales bacterium]
MPDLSSIVKAYDIRGVVGEHLDAATVRDIGAAFARLVGDAVQPLMGGAYSPSAVVIGHDMRESSPGLATAFADGVTEQGLDVVLIGLASTDMLYFASGSLNLPGAMFTASHNPAKWNGIKLCRAGASPVGQDTGLIEI